MRTGVVAICMLAVLGAGVSNAQDFGHHHGDAGWGAPLPLLLRHALLTPEQKTQVNQVFKQEGPALKALENQMGVARDQLTNQLFTAHAKPLTLEDLTAQAQQISQIQNQILNERLKMAVAIHNILTPGQLQKDALLVKQLRAIRTQLQSLLASGNLPPSPAD